MNITLRYNGDGCGSDVSYNAGNWNIDWLTNLFDKRKEIILIY